MSSADKLFLNISEESNKNIDDDDNNDDDGECL